MVKKRGSVYVTLLLFLIVLVGLLLPVAAQQEKELSLESVLIAVGVEIAEEGVLLEHLHEQIGLEFALDEPGQRRFTDADGALDGDVRIAGHREASSCGTAGVQTGA